jgi:hypothetical protein
LRRARNVLVFAVLLTGLISPVPTALAVSPIPEPHSSCLSEPDRVSLEGQAPAELTVVNNTDATFDLFWLDYAGTRVYYRDAPPHTSQVQKTWLTHPWILTDPDGKCYLLIVMTSQRQTMTIGSTTGEQPVTPVPSQETTTTFASSTTVDQATSSVPATPSPTPPGAQEEPEEDSPGFPTPLVIGALVMMGVLVGVLAATGKLFKPKPPRGG